MHWLLYVFRHHVYSSQVPLPWLVPSLPPLPDLRETNLHLRVYRRGIREANPAALSRHRLLRRS